MRAPAPSRRPRGVPSAVVLAAGYSSRMGRLKPLLDLCGATVLERTVASLQGAGIPDVAVVVGHRAEALRPVVARLGARCVLNPEYDAGMYHSLAAGLRALPPRARACLVLPADVPAVRPATVRAVVEAWRRSDAAVAYPTFGGARGHPVLLAARVVPAVIAPADGADPGAAGGLRTVLAAWEEDAVEVPVPDEGILRDADTPDDLERVRALCRDRSVLTPAECAALLADQGAPEQVVRHGEAVAAVARALGRRLVAAGHPLDLALVDCAARVHDLARSRPDHARAGARILRRLGFERIAAVVAAHTDLPPEERPRIAEAPLVYLADKLVQGGRVVTLDERFRAATDRWGGSPGAIRALRRRRLAAAEVAGAVEAALGAPLAPWLARAARAAARAEEVA